MSSDIETEIKNIMSTVLDVDVGTINPSATSETIGNWDSLKHMNLIVALEEKFSITLDDEDILDMLSFESIVKKIATATGS